MSQEPSRKPRQTVREFNREIDELGGTTRSPERCLPAFARALSSFLDGAAVTLHLYDEEDREFTLQGSTVHVPAPVEGEPFRAAGTLQGLALAEQRVVNLGEPPVAGTGRLRAEEHVFPLEAEGSPLGAVTVIQVAAEPLSPLRLDQARRGIARFGAALVAARSAQAHAQRLDRLSAINEFGVILVSALSLDEVPSLATAMTSFIMGVEGCILRLRDGEPPGSSVRDAHGLRDELSSREILRLEELAARQVLDSGKSLLVRDVARDEAFRSCTTRVKTFICSPITGASGTIGTITLFNKTPESPLSSGRFARQDQEVLQHLVRYIEKALANATVLARSRELAQRDELTGLPDRASFQTRLLSEINRARRFQQRIALVTCELETRPAPEDSPAGQAAQQMMCRLAQAIRAAVREYDTVARIGERTFGIILPQVQNGTASPVGRIRSAIDREVEQQRPSVSGEPLRVRFSHATFPEDADSGEQMLTRVEKGG